MTVEKGLYQHYKGPIYDVIDVATHSETEEPLVVYRALYGDKGIWVRPLSMFYEMVEAGGKSVPRFARLDRQTGVLEVAILDVKPKLTNEFEMAFAEAETIIASMDGYISHSLSACVERDNRYLLLVNWQHIDDHTKGFRESREYERWRRLLHHFYEPFPDVEHYRSVSD